LAHVFRDAVIVHLSDLHTGKIGVLEERIIESLTRLEPDLILLSGDFVKWQGDYEPALEFLSKLDAKYGVWGVLGDYDYSDSRKSCVFCHESGTGQPTRRHSVHFLRNSWQELSLPEGSLLICGVDYNDTFSMPLEFHLPEKAVRIPTVVLSHNPLVFDSIPRNKYLLMLAGDTHGGQAPFPSWFWRLVGYEKCAKYDYGLFESGQKKMYVSKGVGTSHIPIRLFRRPEIVVYHFES